MAKNLKIIFLILFLILPMTSHAAYKIFLKNGSEIVVDAYEKVNGEVQFYLHGGVVRIKERDIDKIKEIKKETPKNGQVILPVEKKTEAEASPSQIERAEKEKYLTELKNKIKEVDEKIAEKEVELKKVEDEYKNLEQTAESLYQQGRRKAIAMGHDPSRWMEALSVSERELMLTKDTKKKALEEDMKKIKEELIFLREQKDELLKKMKETP